jgi:hypothetical protein
MAKLITTYWRDIPAQVTVSERREKVKSLLSDRFAIAIDQAAMRAKMIGSDAYLEQWRRETVKCGNDMKPILEQAIENLEKLYTDQYLSILVKNKGVDSSTS